MEICHSHTLIKEMTISLREIPSVTEERKMGIRHLHMLLLYWKWQMRLSRGLHGEIESFEVQVRTSRARGRCLTLLLIFLLAGLL